MAARRGTDLHDLAHNAIKLGVKFDTRAHGALAKYVNDGIGYKMECEVCVYYSDNCFGHADTLSFRRNKLRIHDLKTGIGKTSERQLEVYAGIFCLEYAISPFDIEIELRIYQGDEIRVYEGDPEVILRIMDKIIDADQKIEMLKEAM